MTKFKRCLTIFFFILILFTFSAEEVKAGTDSFGFISIGYGGKDEALSLSLAMGLENHKYFGVEVGVVFSKQYGPYYEYPCPFSHHDVVGKRKVENAWGFDILRIVDLSEKITVYGGIGLYRQKYALVARTNSSRSYYWQSTEYKYDVGFSAGIHYKFTKGSFGLLVYN